MEKKSQEYSINISLDKLSTHTVEEVAAHLMRLGLNSEDKLFILAKKIHLRATEDDILCSKYVKLAEILSNVSCQQIETYREITFKEIFINHSDQQFERIRTSSGLRHNLASFYAHLFVEGLVSSTLMRYWIDSLNYRKDLQNIMLDRIKDKVDIDSFLYPKDHDIRDLKTMLLKRKIIQVDSKALERVYVLS